LNSFLTGATDRCDTLKGISPSGFEDHFTINGSVLYLKGFSAVSKVIQSPGGLETLHCGMCGFDGVFDIAG
jgi:hypothetical protein